MQFMMIVMHAEGQGNPPKELGEAIAKMSEEAAKAGIAAAAEGSCQRRWAPAFGFRKAS